MAPLNSTLRYNDATYNLTDCLLSISDISIVSLDCRLPLQRTTRQWRRPHSKRYVASYR